MKFKHVFVSLLILISLSAFIIAQTSSSTINWLSKGNADILYCRIMGNCEINNLLIIGNLNQTEGNATINNIYGEMWNRTSAANPFLFDIADVGVYYNLTGLVSNMNNGFTFTAATQENGGSYLTAQYDGRYKIDATISSIVGAASGDVYGYAISHEFVRANHNNCYARRTAVNKLGNIGISCIMDIESGTKINIQIEQETGGVARDISFSTVNINALRIGDIP